MHILFNKLHPKATAQGSAGYNDLLAGFVERIKIPHQSLAKIKTGILITQFKNFRFDVKKNFP